MLEFITTKITNKIYAAKAPIKICDVNVDNIVI